MNPLPSDFDLTHYVGDELTLICVSFYQIQLHFKYASIEGAGDVELETNGEVKQIFKNSRLKSTDSLELVANHEVTSWEVRDKFTFALNFEKGSLVLHSKEGPYESFTVSTHENDYYIL